MMYLSFDEKLKEEEKTKGRPLSSNEREDLWRMCVQEEDEARRKSWDDWVAQNEQARQEAADREEKIFRQRNDRWDEQQRNKSHSSEPPGVSTIRPSKQSSAIKQPPSGQGDQDTSNPANGHSVENPDWLGQTEAGQNLSNGQRILRLWRDSHRVKREFGNLAEFMEFCEVAAHRRQSVQGKDLGLEFYESRERPSLNYKAD